MFALSSSGQSTSSIGRCQKGIGIVSGLLGISLFATGVLCIYFGRSTATSIIARNWVLALGGGTMLIVDTIALGRIKCILPATPQAPKPQPQLQPTQELPKQEAVIPPYFQETVDFYFQYQFNVLGCESEYVVLKYDANGESLTLICERATHKISVQTSPKHLPIDEARRRWPEVTPVFLFQAALDKMSDEQRSYQFKHGDKETFGAHLKKCFQDPAFRAAIQ